MPSLLSYKTCETCKCSHLTTDSLITLMSVFVVQLSQLRSHGEMHLQPRTGWCSLAVYVCVVFIDEFYFSNLFMFHLQVGWIDCQ